MKTKKEKTSDVLHKYGLAYKSTNQDVLKELLKQNFTEFQANIISNRIDDENFEIYKDEIVLHYFNCLHIDRNIKLLTDIDRGSELILKHIKNNNHIAIVTDYDCDGVNSAIVLYKSLIDVFKYDKDKVSVIINRRRNGNGFNNTLISRVKELHAKKPIGVLLAADHGSSDNKAYTEFKELGIEMVITDHHKIPNDNNPDSCEVFINNQRSDSTYYKDVCGCFVAFITMVNTYKVRYPNSRLDVFNPILPYVAIATISDVMSLKVPMNRHVVKTGLNEMNSFRNKAWLYIKKILNINGKITYKELGFKIAPLINTANRIDSEDLAFKLLSAEDQDDIIKYAEELNKLNDFRKIVQKNTINNAKDVVLKNIYKNSIVLVLDTELSISGIIASSVGETNHLPTVCFLNNPDQKVLVGSSRGIVKGLSVVGVFNSIHAEDNTIFPIVDGKVMFGGHDGAAGCSVFKDKLEDFKRLFDKYCKVDIDKVPKSDVIMVDMFLPESKLNPGIVKPIESMGPYGKDWPEPVFVSILYVAKVIIMKNIAKIFFVTTSGKEISAMHFFKSQHDINVTNIKDILLPKTKVLVVYTINLDNIRSYMELNINIIDVKPIGE